MDIERFDLSLSGKWLYHKGDFEYRRDLSLGELQATCKSGGHLSGFEFFDDPKSWQEVTVPHDALIREPYCRESDSSGGYKKRITCWYKRSFLFSETEYESSELIFDGVLGKCEVYVNGVRAASNLSGYNRFFCDIGDYLHYGENTVAVYVDARRPEGWWYEGAGIYRNVYLTVTGKSHIDRKNCFTYSEYTDGKWSAVADIAVNAPEGLTLRATLSDDIGNTVASCNIIASEKVRIMLPLYPPSLWTPEEPTLYPLKIELYRRDKIIDVYNSNIGFRTVEWDSECGMRLNGKPYMVKGLCSHQDHAGVGAAVTPELEEYRIGLMKSLGANAYRCVHHAPSESLLEICDRLGMLVMVENRHFAVDRDTLYQLDSLVKLSRNHPSVFLYAIFNEEPWQANEKGYRIAKKLKDRIAALDSTRWVIGSQNFGHTEPQNAAHALDIVGANYSLDQFKKIRKLFPEKVILGTENCPTYATRGITETNEKKQVFADNGDHYPSVFSESLWETVETVNNLHYVAGSFVFCGLDYLGEPHPYGYPSVGSHWGMLDSCGFNKNISYWLMSAYKTEPMLKLCVFPKGESARVIVFTNAEGAELLSGEVSYGWKKAEHNKIEWTVPTETEYHASAAVGKTIVTDQYKKAGRFSSLTVTDVTPVCKAPSVKIINICAVDENGIPVDDCFEILNITLLAGELLGVGNGDPNGHHSSNATTIPLFCGKGQIILSSDSVGEVECKGTTYKI